ncbi:MAG: DUF4954 family protein [Rikenellaceae bacterium]
MLTNSRKLTKFEIGELLRQGVQCSNWQTIDVAPEFDVHHMYNARLEGKVYIGKGVKIFNIGSKISDCIISDDVTLENVASITCQKDANFGIGVKVNVVNENGGRCTPMYLGMTAQSAYYIAMYRHKDENIAKFFSLIDAQKTKNANSLSVISKGTRISNCGTIDSVHIGEGNTLEGITLLKNGTTHSDCYLGYGVIMRDFICEKGSMVDNASQLNRCFVGESAKIDSGFSAVDSMFFANCDMANGECCSVFAGPYTVSHHKSSLLIAGLFSFFNAGSGSNQSNHLFKTGAVHQAIHERGCKYGSNAYIMAPAHTGAYNVVLSRHSSHHNTQDFPFSYLLENDGKSFLMPGAGLRSSGTARDIEKWQNRDKREGEKKDLINFEKWNPYITNKIIRAIEISEKLLEKDMPIYTHERVRITSAMLRRGLQNYKMALNIALGNALENKAELSDYGTGEWIDMAGMYAPKELIDSLEIETLEQFHEELRNIFMSYNVYSYTWALDKVKGQDIDQIIAQSKSDSEALSKIIESDIKSDSSALMMTGYGIDESDNELKTRDFKQVRNLE